MEGAIAGFGVLAASAPTPRPWRSSNIGRGAEPRFHMRDTLAPTCRVVCPPLQWWRCPRATMHSQFVCRASALPTRSPLLLRFEQPCLFLRLAKGPDFGTTVYLRAPLVRQFELAHD